MRVGASTDFTRVQFVKDAGYDYLELSLFAVSKLTDEEFEEKAELVKSLGLKVEAFNGFFGPTVTLVGENADLEGAREYVKKALARAKRLGGEIAVFGSGGLRSIPEGFDRETGLKQLDDVIRMMGDEGQKVGITIVLENLNSRETNTLTTVEDVIETVKRVNHKNVRGLVDFYHMFMENESLDSVRNSEGLIAHAHLARPNADRKIPDMDDIGPIREWRKSLDDCGYSARISIEASPRGEGTYPVDIMKAREVMKIFE